MASLDAFVEGLNDSQAAELKVFKVEAVNTVFSKILETILNHKTGNITPTYLFTAASMATLDVLFSLNKVLASKNVSAAQILRMRIKELVHEW
jgi:hypothetical protein